MHRLRRFMGVELLDNRYPSLHGLRVLGILSVIQLHVTLNLENKPGLVDDPALVQTSKTVFFGMDLFFVLSGFLIGTILLRSIESGGAQGLRRFYLRRIFRTFPPYYLVLTLFVMWLSPLKAAQHRHLWMEYTYVSNYAVPFTNDQVAMPWGWSLSLEEQFYLGVPLLMLLLYKIRGDAGRVAALGFLWVLPLGLRLVAFLRHPQWSDPDFVSAVYFPTHTRVDTLIGGILIAYAQHRWRDRIEEALGRPSVRAALALSSLACLWVLMNPLMFGEDEGLKLLHVFAWGTLTTLMYFGWITLLLSGGDGWVRRALSLPLCRVVATLGYGVYLLHAPVLIAVVPALCAFARHGSRPMWLVWSVGTVIVMCASLAAAYLLHILVEKPSLRIRDWLTS